MRNIETLKLSTQRLDIVPLSLTQLLMYSSFDYLLEKELGTIKHKRALPLELTHTLGQFIIPYVTQHPQQLLFGTLWAIIDHDTNIIVGDIGFKGMPSSRGLLEVGYGTYPDFENRGYMTEALSKLAAWAFDQSGVDMIVAETDKDNIPSQKILTKNKFMPFAETDLAYWWRLDRDAII